MLSVCSVYPIYVIYDPGITDLKLSTCSASKTTGQAERTSEVFIS